MEYLGLQNFFSVFVRIMLFCFMYDRFSINFMYDRFSTLFLLNFQENKFVVMGFKPCWIHFLCLEICTLMKMSLKYSFDY